MVQIPIFKESQRLQVSNPTGFRSSGQARIEGETIAQFGKGLADIGDKLNEVDKRQKSALAATQKDLVKNNLRREAIRISAELKLRGDDGSKWNEDFDKMYGEAKNKILNDMDKGGAISQLSQEQIEAISGGISNGFNEDLYASSFQRQNEILKKNVSDLTARYTSQSYESPEMVEEQIADFSATMTEAMKAMGKDDRFTQSYVKSGKQQLIRQAVMGFQDKNKFDQAKKLLLENGDAFSAEEQRKVLSDIRASKMNYVRERQSEEDRRERMLNQEMKAEQAKNLGVILGELEEAKVTGDSTAIAKTRRKLIDSVKEGKISATHFGGASSKLGQAKQEEYSQTNLNFMREYYKLSSDADKAAFEQKIVEAVSNDRMDENSAIQMLKMINHSKSSRLLSPKQKAMYDFAENTLKTMLPPVDDLAKLQIRLDPDYARSHIAKQYGIKAEMDRHKAIGLDALDSLGIVIDKYMQGFDAIIPFPGIGEAMIRDVSELKSAKSEQEESAMMRKIHAAGVKVFLGNPTKESEFEMWFNSLSIALEEKRLKRRYESEFKAQAVKDKQLLEKAQNDAASKATSEFIERTLNDAYNLRNPDELPLILRQTGD